MIELREALKRLVEADLTVEVEEETEPDLGLARVLRSRQDRSVVFRNVRGFKGTVVGNLVSSRLHAALSLGVSVERLVDAIGDASDHPGILEKAEEAPFMAGQHVAPDLANLLPLGRSFPKDGGPYASAFIVAARSRRSGMNLSFHRMMHLGGNRLAVRVVRRHLFRILEEEGGRCPAAVICGVHPAVLLAAAFSGKEELDELKMAAALMGGRLECVELEGGLMVPAHCEIAMLGRFTGERAKEGPFVDLTGTYDVVREEPVFCVEKLWLRDDPLYHMILPGGREHKVLMGLPREPAILKAARAVSPAVSNVVLTEGGGGWLHAVLELERPDPENAVRAGKAALDAHRSLKRVVLVDSDIDIHDPTDVEWALATRFQPHRDLEVIRDVAGSTLDPSRSRDDEKTSKWILDATMGTDLPSKEFIRAEPE